MNKKLQMQIHQTQSLDIVEHFCTGKIADKTKNCTFIEDLLYKLSNNFYAVSIKCDVFTGKFW